MKWASALSTRGDFEPALDEALDVIEGELGGEVDLVFAFVSPHHDAYADAVGPMIRARFPGARVVGCSGGGVVGAGRETEQSPALSLTAGHLPGARVLPFHVGGERLPTDADGWRAHLGAADEPLDLVLLVEPFTVDAQRLLATLEGAFPDSNIVGGLASGGRGAGQNALFLDDTAHRGGAVGVALAGDVRVDAVVAQGCRPIGAPMFITACDGHLLQQLDGGSALEALERTCRTLPPADLELARRSLFLGLVMDPERERYGAGDFVIRNLLGALPEQGALAVGANLRERGVVQFHLRDAEASATELDALLQRYAEERGAPAGGLMFACLGRGRGLYGVPNHDASAFKVHVGETPLGGFFCNGEIGPVGGRAYLHGYTSSFALFRPRQDDDPAA